MSAHLTNEELDAVERVGPRWCGDETFQRLCHMARGALAPLRAKFTVESITWTKYWYKPKGDICTIKLRPVNGDSPENDAFFAGTPSGTIELGTINSDVAAQFDLGCEYFVDFTKAG